MFKARSPVVRLIIEVVNKITCSYVGMVVVKCGLKPAKNGQTKIYKIKSVPQGLTLHGNLCLFSVGASPVACSAGVSSCLCHFLYLQHITGEEQESDLVCDLSQKVWTMVIEGAFLGSDFRWSYYIIGRYLVRRMQQRISERNWPFLRCCFEQALICLYSEYNINSMPGLCTIKRTFTQAKYCDWLAWWTQWFSQQTRSERGLYL